MKDLNFGFVYDHFTPIDNDNKGVLGLSGRKYKDHPSFVLQLADINAVRIFVRKNPKKKSDGELTLGKNPLVPSHYCGEHELTVELSGTRPGIWEITANKVFLYMDELSGSNKVYLTIEPSNFIVDSGTGVICKFQ